VSGLRDPEMIEVCAELGVPVVIGHMQGEPATMQQRPRYADAVAEVRGYLAGRAEAALARGVPSVLVDPGIGFGKTVEHNLALLRAVDRFGPHPVVVGASRKGLIGRLAGVANPKDRLPGTLALHLWAALHGAALVRAHDVAEHRQALTVLAALLVC
jgi:dihydropteroate synthase